MGGAETDYRLTIEQGQGQGGTFDAMNHNNGTAFSTPDRDNDHWSDGSCAVDRNGAWWYYNCSLTLNTTMVLLIES